MCYHTAKCGGPQPRPSPLSAHCKSTKQKRLPHCSSCHVQAGMHIKSFSFPKPQNLSHAKCHNECTKTPMPTIQETNGGGHESTVEYGLKESPSINRREGAEVVYSAQE